jgi:hypothetical protein
MFLLPLGLLGGAKLSIADTIVKNMIPATIGNAIAGAVVVAAGYSFQFGKLGNARTATPPSSRTPRLDSPPQSESHSETTGRTETTSIPDDENHHKHGASRV